MTRAFVQSSRSAGKRRKLLLLAGATAALFPFHGAYAQSEGDGEDAAGDPIVVTGSRIRGVAPVGSNLIDVGAEQIEKSGATTVSDVLRQVPQITSLSINAEGATGAGAGSNITRATGPNLRGLGSTATLTVIDGLRVPIAGTQGNFVDPSFVPSLAIQRLEVIADGASAIYGSDAVAGVINLIPRKNFTGMEVRGRVGLADSYSEYQISGIAGGKWDTGNLVVSAEYLHNNALLGSDRDFVSADRRWGGGADSRSTACSPATISANGTTYAVPYNANGVFDFNSLTAGTANRCDLTKPGFLIPEQERISLYGYFNQELGSTLSVFAQGFYSRREFSGPLAGQYSVTNVVVPDSNPFYPTNAPSGIAVSTNFIDADGLRYTQGQSETYLVNAGIRGTFGEWEVKLAGSYGESSDEEDRDPGINVGALSAVLANPDPAQSINPFGTSANNPSIVDSVFLDLFNPAVTNQLRSVELEANGPLFTIPGGEVRMALGAEYREERQSGSFTFGPKTSPISLPNNISRDVKAVFAELYVPIVGEGNASPGLQRLDILAAVRHEEYSDFGKTTNPKIGVTWSPVDGLSLRGSYGTSFRAPGLAEVDPNSSGANIYQFPYFFPGNPLPLNLAVVAAGNPNLQPETAETWSAGFDITPVALPGFRFGATYFDVKYEGQVIDVFTILPQVLAEPENFGNIAFLRSGSQWQDGIDFITGTQYYIPGSINFNLLDGIVDGRKANLGTTLASGMDFDASYRFDAGESEFVIGANATLFFNYENSTGGGQIVSRLGTYGFPQKFRGRAMVGWTRGPISAQATVNHLSGYTNLTSALVQDVSSYTTLDLDLGYTFGEESGGVLSGVRLGVNARNLFDRDPPFVDAGMGYDPSAASALGRIVSFSISKAL